MKQKLLSDLVIIGGGASGLTAAIFAARRNKNKRIIILESQDRVGKKILVTGNGRCNLLNKNISVENYNFDAQNFLKSHLIDYSYKKILKFFHSLGLITRSDSEGRIYPFCSQASAVLDVLRLECKKLGVIELCNFKIQDILLKNKKFLIYSENFEIVAENVVCSTGGAALFNDEQFNNIYKILIGLGHTYKKIFPALVPIKTNMGFEKYLKGVRATAKIKVLKDKALIKEEIGEIQFTDKGISGICIFQISRLVSEFLNLNTINGEKCKNVIISVDLLPKLSLNEIIEVLLERISNFSSESIDCLFSGILNKKFLIPILKASDIFYKNRKLFSISKEEVFKIANTIKNFLFVLSNTMSFKNSQVMSGGINLFEVNHLTLESLKVKKLYITGELLNVDGDCGGYNLYWAWTSGMIVGNSINL